MKFFFVYFSLLQTLLFSNSSRADLKSDALNVLPKERTILVTGHPEYPPIIWKPRKDDSLKGVAVELVTQAFAELGVTVKTVNAGSWGRAQEEVKAGRADMLLPPYLNAERITNYEFYAEPILMDETAIFVKKGKAFKYDSPESLIPLTGVALIEDSYGTEFDQFMKTKLKVERLNRTPQCFEFLLHDRADYMIAGLNAGLAVAHRNKIKDKIEVLPKRVISTGMYAAISRKSPWNKPEIHTFINKRIAAYTKDGLVKKLEKKYWHDYNREY